jgi:hypothetical protein
MAPLERAVPCCSCAVLIRFGSMAAAAGRSNAEAAPKTAEAM